MLLLIDSISPTLLTIIIAVLVVHFLLAVSATYKMFKYQTKGPSVWTWHFVVQLGIIIGPIVFHILHPKYMLKERYPTEETTTNEETPDEKEKE